MVNLPTVKRLLNMIIIFNFIKSIAFQFSNDVYLHKRVVRNNFLYSHYVDINFQSTKLKKSIRNEKCIIFVSNLVHCVSPR